MRINLHTLHNLLRYISSPEKQNQQDIVYTYKLHTLLFIYQKTKFQYTRFQRFDLLLLVIHELSSIQSMQQKGTPMSYPQ
jgi:hypothetical protein